MHDDQSRLAALHSARAGLSTDDRSNFTHTMLGTLAYYVDDDVWMRALEAATEIVDEDIERRGVA